MSSPSPRYLIVTGAVMLAMAVYLSWLLLTEDVSRWWRLALVGLYLPAMLGLLQAKEKT